MKQKELKKIEITHKFDCWEDFDLSNKSIYERILRKKVFVAEKLFGEIKCFFGEKDVWGIMPDFDARKFDYSQKCRNKKFQKFCNYFREYIKCWVDLKIDSHSLEDYLISFGDYPVMTNFTEGN